MDVCNAHHIFKVFRNHIASINRDLMARFYHKSAGMSQQSMENARNILRSVMSMFLGEFGQILAKILKLFGGGVIVQGEPEHFV